MKSSNTTIQHSQGATTGIIVVESPAGVSRRSWLDARLQEASRTGARTFLIPCHFDEGGPWAGPSSFISRIFEEIQSERPDLVHKRRLVQEKVWYR